jgi:glycine betaine/proline transport system permease protein
MDSGALAFPEARMRSSIRPNILTGWVLAIVLLGACLILRDQIPVLQAYPKSASLPFAAWIDQLLQAAAPLKPAFRLLRTVIEWPFLMLRQGLSAVPWPIAMVTAVCLVLEFAGRKAASATLIALLSCLVTGYWQQSMTTLALVMTAIPYAAVSGFALGVIGARSHRAKLWIEPALDLMQTVPTFAYLIPLLVFFGFGPAVGLIASVVFALPPMVRNTIIALEQVPPEILEAATMAGCKPWQKFLWAEVPTARQQLLVGLNQTTLSVFSMLIIAALIGGFGDIGWEVLTKMRQASFGGTLTVGFLIVLLAVALDRITDGFVHAASNPRHTKTNAGISRAARWLILSAVVATMLVFLPENLEWPSQYTLDAKRLDGVTNEFVAGYAPAIDAFKTAVVLFLLLPVKIGLENSVSESTWGFDLIPSMVWMYWGFAGVASAFAVVRRSAQCGFAILFIAATLYLGVTGLPWAGLVVAVVAGAASAGGARLALFVAAALAFILMSGYWDAALVSLYLCSVAVALSFVIGFPIGVLAARNDRVWSVVRPICDFLQTIPQFVYLIPVLMLFGVGDFAGLIAVTSYSVVPIIRYTNEGLRRVPAVQMEAAKACGCTPAQTLLDVQLPQALPVILLGINQAILFALGMLVISSLVGTDGLGQEIYVALSKNQPGAGLVAGLCMALIGILSDRILRSVVRNRMTVTSVGNPGETQ